MILMNPGGPGGDVTGFLDSKNYPAPDKFYKDNALVAIQPRGLTGSTPLHCESAAACNEYVDQHPGYLKSLSTENIARDMDTFRKLAGLKKISYYGGSWGTELGAEYATLFPKYTDKMVLDSAVDPNKVGVMNGDQMRAVDARLYQWFSFVAEHDDKYQLGDTPLKVFNAWKTAMKAADKEAGNTKTSYKRWSCLDCWIPTITFYRPPPRSMICRSFCVRLALWCYRSTMCSTRSGRGHLTSLVIWWAPSCKQ